MILPSSPLRRGIWRYRRWSIWVINHALRMAISAAAPCAPPPAGSSPRPNLQQPTRLGLASMMCACHRLPSTARPMVLFHRVNRRRRKSQRLVHQELPRVPSEKDSWAWAWRRALAASGADLAPPLAMEEGEGRGGAGQADGGAGLGRAAGGAVQP
jgi:hypothetical protein